MPPVRASWTGGNWTGGNLRGGDGPGSTGASPRAIPELKQKLAGVRLEPLADSIDGLLATPTTAAIEQSLRHYMTERREPQHGCSA